MKLGQDSDLRPGAFLLSDGTRFTATEILSLRLDRHPFVFINADASPDMAVALLRAGASAVVASGWAIKDADAPVFAEAFYAGVLTERERLLGGDALTSWEAAWKKLDRKKLHDWLPGG